MFHIFFETLQMNKALDKVVGNNLDGIVEITDVTIEMENTLFYRTLQRMYFQTLQHMIAMVLSIQSSFPREVAELIARLSFPDRHWVIDHLLLYGTLRVRVPNAPADDDGYIVDDVSYHIHETLWNIVMTINRFVKPAAVILNAEESLDWMEIRVK